MCVCVCVCVCVFLNSQPKTAQYVFHYYNTLKMFLEYIILYLTYINKIFIMFISNNNQANTAHQSNKFRIFLENKTISSPIC